MVNEFNINIHFKWFHDKNSLQMIYDENAKQIISIIKMHNKLFYNKNPSQITFIIKFIGNDFILKIHCWWVNKNSLPIHFILKCTANEFTLKKNALLIFYYKNAK